MKNYRLHYHLMPPLGSLADPNGLCCIDGVYHIYYIYNPLACVSERRTACLWGHYTTQDFIAYKQEPIALYPDTIFDKDGVYSGSAIYEEGKLTVFYTGNVRHDGHYDYIHNGRQQNVMMVDSSDTLTFMHKTKLFGNEEFPQTMTQHIRDPYVYKEKDTYYMLLGARSNEDVGGVLLYQSKDKKEWDYCRFITTPLPFGYMWECPDYSIVDKQPLLICCPQGVKDNQYQNVHQCGYFELNKPITQLLEVDHFQPFDYGFDLYAARTLQDDHNQTLLIGWMGMPECEYSQNQTVTDGWMQAMIMPRLLTYKNHHLYQSPLPSLKQLRKNEKKLSLKDNFVAEGNCFELILKMDTPQDVSIYLREDFHLHYDMHAQLLTLSMDQCGDHRKQRILKLDSLHQLQIISDTSSLEIFINDGYYTMTTRIFGHSQRILIEKIEAEAYFYELSAFKILV